MPRQPDKISDKLLHISSIYTVAAEDTEQFRSTIREDTIKSSYATSPLDDYDRRSLETNARRAFSR